MSTNARALTGYGIQFRWPPTKILPGGIHADWLRDVCLTQLLLLDDIAERADVSRSTIRRALAFNEIRRARRQGMHPSTPRSPHPHADRPGGVDSPWLRTRYVRRHCTLKEIAGVLGIGVTTVHSAVHAHSLTRSSIRRSRNALGDEQWLRTRYLDEAATARHIAVELTVPVSTARRSVAGGHSPG